jgi:hypothetical protein
MPELPRRKGLKQTIRHRYCFSKQNTIAQESYLINNNRLISNIVLLEQNLLRYPLSNLNSASEVFKGTGRAYFLPD